MVTRARLGAGLVVLAVLSGCTSSEPAPVESAVSNDTRWVGANGVMVAVPDDWDAMAPSCGTAIGPPGNCSSGAASLDFILNATASSYRFESGTEETRMVSDLEVRSGVLECVTPGLIEDTNACEGPGIFVAIIAELDVALVLTGQAAVEPLRSEIAGSLQRVPDRSVTVPPLRRQSGFRVASESLTSAGMTVAPLDPAVGPFAPVTLASPARYAVVPRGTQAVLEPVASTRG